MTNSLKDITTRIAQLSKELHHHNHMYYKLNDPEISDEDYDKLFTELTTLRR